MTAKDFFNRYVYDAEKDILGSGGFGAVYKAYDKLDKKYVAIKISQVKDIYGKFTLLNEVELSKNIDHHANVARYDFGLRVTQPFLIDYAVMDYYEEGNLDMVLKKNNGQLSDKEYYEITEGILEGIRHLHDENVIHRDLKLANILMHRTKQGQWRPKIADFGLSRQTENFDDSISNSAIGITIAYAAPEQIENRPIRKNVDLWAFGVVLYKFLVGEMPFIAAKGAEPTSATLEISRKITQGVFPEKLNTLQEPYLTIIKRCWVKDNRERVQDAAELLAILKRKNESQTVSHSPVETTEAILPSTPKEETPIEIETIVETLENKEVESLNAVLDTEIKQEDPPASVETDIKNESKVLAENITSIEDNRKSEVDNLFPEIKEATPAHTPSVDNNLETILDNKEEKGDKAIPKIKEKTPKYKKDNEVKPESISAAISTEKQEKVAEKPIIAPETKPVLTNNRRKMAVLSGILACLLGFGVCKFMPGNIDNNINANPTIEQPVVVSQNNGQVPVNTPVGNNSVKNPTDVSKTNDKKPTADKNIPSPPNTPVKPSEIPPITPDNTQPDTDAGYTPPPKTKPTQPLPKKTVEVNPKQLEDPKIVPQKITLQTLEIKAKAVGSIISQNAICEWRNIESVTISDFSIDANGKVSGGKVSIKYKSGRSKDDTDCENDILEEFKKLKDVKKSKSGSYNPYTF